MVSETRKFINFPGTGFLEQEVVGELRKCRKHGVLTEVTKISLDGEIQRTCYNCLVEEIPNVSVAGYILDKEYCFQDVCMNNATRSCLQCGNAFCEEHLDDSLALPEPYCKGCVAGDSPVVGMEDDGRSMLWACCAGNCAAVGHFQCRECENNFCNKHMNPSRPMCLGCTPDGG